MIESFLWSKLKNSLPFSCTVSHKQSLGGMVSVLVSASAMRNARSYHTLLTATIPKCLSFALLVLPQTTLQNRGSCRYHHTKNIDIHSLLFMKQSHRDVVDDPRPDWAWSPNVAMNPDNHTADAIVQRRRNVPRQHSLVTRHVAASIR